MAHAGFIFLGKRVGKFLGEVDVNGRHSSKLLDYIVYVNACSVSTPEIVTFLYSIRRNISSIKLYFRLKSSNGAVAWHECQRSCVVCFIVRWTVPFWIPKLVRKMRIVFLISIMQIGKSLFFMCYSKLKYINYWNGNRPTGNPSGNITTKNNIVESSNSEEKLNAIRPFIHTPLWRT